MDRMSGTCSPLHMQISLIVVVVVIVAVLGITGLLRLDSKLGHAGPVVVLTHAVRSGRRHRICGRPRAGSHSPRRFRTSACRPEPCRSLFRQTSSCCTSRPGRKTFISIFCRDCDLVQLVTRGATYDSLRWLLGLDGCFDPFLEIAGHSLVADGLFGVESSHGAMISGDAKVIVPLDDGRFSGDDL